MISLSDRAGFLIVANLIKYAVGFIMPMVLVRMLSQSDYGTYQQLVLVGNTALALMVLGLPTSIYYFYHNVPQSRIPALLAQTSVMLAASGLVAATGIYLFSGQISEAMNNPAMATLLSIYAVSIFFMIASEHSIHFLIAQNRYGLAVGLEVAETILRVSVLLAPLALGFGFAGLIVGIVIYALVRFVVRGAFLVRGISFAGWWRETFTADQLAYSIPLALMSLSGQLAGAFNKGVVASSFTPAEYAIYAVGILEIPLDVIFQASVANVLRASLPPLVRDGNLEEVVRLIRESMRKLAIIVLPSFVFLFGYAEPFITQLFTSRYSESVHVFQIYVWLVPLHMLVLSPIPQVFGKPKINMYIVLVTGFLLVSLSYILVKTVGFYGPALAVLIATYITVTIYFVVVIKLTRASFLALLPVSPMLRIIGASLVSLLASQLAHSLGSPGLLRLVLAGLVFSVTFLPSAALFGVFTPGDYQLMRRWIAKVLPVSGHR